MECCEDDVSGWLCEQEERGRKRTALGNVVDDPTLGLDGVVFRFCVEDGAVGLHGWML